MAYAFERFANGAGDYADLCEELRAEILTEFLSPELSSEDYIARIYENFVQDLYADAGKIVEDVCFSLDHDTPDFSDIFHSETELEDTVLQALLKWLYDKEKKEG